MSSISHNNVTASHCTIIGQGWNGSDGRHYHLVSAVAQVDNCIVYGGNGHGIQANTHNNNLVYVTHADSHAYVEWEAAGYDSDEVSAGTGDLTGDPKFVTAPTQGSITPFNMDLSLQASSPAVNAGSSLFTHDISGSARDSNPDIGAYELVAAPSGYQNSVTGVVAGSLGAVFNLSLIHI